MCVLCVSSFQNWFSIFYQPPSSNLIFYLHRLLCYSSSSLAFLFRKFPQIFIFYSWELNLFVRFQSICWPTIHLLSIIKWASLISRNVIFKSFPFQLSLSNLKVIVESGPCSCLNKFQIVSISLLLNWFIQSWCPPNLFRQTSSQPQPLHLSPCLEG